MSVMTYSSNNDHGHETSTTTKTIIVTVECNGNSEGFKADSLEHAAQIAADYIKGCDLEDNTGDDLRVYLSIED